MRTTAVSPSKVELGTLPDGNSQGGIDTAAASLTDPDTAAAFVAATQIDALAVSIGNVHTLKANTAEVDLDRLAEIDQAVSVPLVIHGGTGFPADAVRAAIARGVAKFNVGTALKRAALEGLGARVRSLSEREGPHDLVGSHRPSDLLEATKPPVIGVVRELMRLYGSSGRGA